MPTTRRASTPESEAEAVRLGTGRGRGPVEGARDLDIGESTPRRRRQAIAAGGAQASPGRGDPPAREGGRRRLRADVTRLAMGRDTLRKATASLAGESS